MPLCGAAASKVLTTQDNFLTIRDTRRGERSCTADCTTPLCRTGEAKVPVLAGPRSLLSKAVRFPAETDETTITPKAKCQASTEFIQD